MARLPLTLIPLVLYALAALFLADSPATVADPAAPGVALWDRAALLLTMVSGTVWSLTFGDLLVAVALVLVLISLIAVAAAGAVSVFASMIKMLVLCAYVVGFLAVGFAATSTFFVLTLIALVDTIATVAISMLRSPTKVQPGQ
ncbi:MAG: hypothetical protein AAFW98_08885 [Pseudomonadota bacterium]